MCIVFSLTADTHIKKCPPPGCPCMWVCLPVRVRLRVHECECLYCGFFENWSAFI